MTSVVFEADVLDDLVGEMLPDAIDLRREIHRHPELGLDNPDTQRRILDAISGLGLDIHTGEGLTSIVADLVGAHPGPTILLRADTDALPMVEESGEPFSSTVQGRAHACGHDAHVAMLVGAARILSEHRDELAGRVRQLQRERQRMARSVEAALGHVDACKREDASHHCFAWRIGQSYRFDDANEPAGTAGRGACRAGTETRAGARSLSRSLPGQSAADR